jgi:hypothetical protein
MSTKHTPAPWGLDESLANEGEIDVISKNGFLIASIVNSDRCDEYNANLISAAPELLDALIDILYDYDSFDSMSDSSEIKARAAIAKATTTGE